MKNISLITLNILLLLISLGLLNITTTDYIFTSILSLIFSLLGVLLMCRLIFKNKKFKYLIYTINFLIFANSFLFLFSSIEGEYHAYNEVKTQKDLTIFYNPLIPITLGQQQALEYRVIENNDIEALNIIGFNSIKNNNLSTLRVILENNKIKFNKEYYQILIDLTYSIDYPDKNLNNILNNVKNNTTLEKKICKSRVVYGISLKNNNTDLKNFLYNCEKTI